MVSARDIETTEGERILAEVVRLLGTVPPSDRYAELSAILLRIITFAAAASKAP